MVAHPAQSVGIPPPVALTMMIVGRWTWGRSAYRWTKSAATMALAIRAKSLSASVMRSRRQQPEYAPVKAACSSPGQSLEGEWDSGMGFAVLRGPPCDERG